MTSLKPFRGAQRKLVLAFDVGTTFSGVAYALLDPGEIPMIQSITRYPGQENMAGDSKIPTILYYDADGSVRAVGGEASLPGMELEAEDDNLHYVEWFKLHLRPESVDSEDFNSADIPPLPLGKTVLDVFADFLKYLFACARRYIIETHANGDRLWSSVEDQIEFVLSHPNGWEGLQQMKMRRAAILGGLIPDTQAGQSRVHFVTEGEASLYFCVQNGLAADNVQNGESVMIVDAGGGTVDVSTYNFKTISPVTVEEVASPDCIVQGSTRVNMRALKLLKDKLQNSRYGNDEDLKTMLDYFDKHAKPIFKDSNESAYIKFGSMSCNDPVVKIRRGQLMLSGPEVASLFERSITAIVDAIQRQRQLAPPSLKKVFLVGGFAASPWLSSQLQSILHTVGLNLSRPDRHTNKAVAEGAVAYYLEQWVSVRMARLTYGVQCSKEYNEQNQEHFIRRGSIVSRPSGRQMLSDVYHVILLKGSRIRDNDEVYQEFYKEARESATLNKISSEITCYRGKSKNPHWIDTEPEMFSTLCNVYADTSRVFKVKQQGPNGPYYTQEYRVILLCGLTELKAQISWMENGEEQRGPATIVYDDDADVLN